MTVSGWLLLLAGVLLAGTAIGHALLRKPDPKAAMGWIAVCVLTPILGPTLYFLFGINRVVTRAQKLASNSPFQADDSTTAALRRRLEIPPAQVPPLSRISANVTGRALLPGNRIEPLHNGEQAYPAMLDAIRNASHSVYMTTYIFNTNRLGQQFITALTEASERGVDVRVIVDGIGEFTNIPRASTRLQRNGVRAERFIPPTLLPPAIYINLRNHRKILVIDDRIAFTGGMNISISHMVEDRSHGKPVTDMHFRLAGPVVAQVRQAFMEDWAFVTDERDPPEPAHEPPLHGSALCRAIIDGPNEYFGQLSAVINAVVCAARHRIAIMTPYFLPSQDMLAVLTAAVLRGVNVQVILPGQIDHPIVHWAARRILGELIRAGVSVYYQPPPFCHTKLLLIDDDYSLIGSANMDPRSLRLNFEFGVEVYDREFAAGLWRHFDDTLAASQRIALAELEQRPLAIRLRDAAAWACSPYL